MNNIRYDKLNVIIHLQNQKSHYKRLIEAKKNIDFTKLDKQTATLQTNNSKIKDRDREIDRQRKENNFKLVNQIIQINKKNGLLQNMEIESRKRKRDISLKNCQGRSRLSKQKINNDNAKMADRLIEAKACVGTRSQWRKHFKRFKSDEKRIGKYDRDKAYDPEHYLRETITSINENKKICERFSSLSNYVKNGNESLQINNFKIGDDRQNVDCEKIPNVIKCRKGKKQRVAKTSQTGRRVQLRALQQKQNGSQELKMEINQILLKDSINSWDRQKCGDSYKTKCQE